MRSFITIAVCKLLYFIGRRMGRGSTLPGRAALAIYPGVFKRIRLPKTIIAVTGSNGKTTTAEMLARALEAGGMRVGGNSEGANQIEGVAGSLLRISTFGGIVDRDALVLECDERFARKIFKTIKPSVLVVTNLCRDQLSRNGHPEFIQDCIRAAIDTSGDGLTLVLNADDPYVAALAAPKPGICVSESAIDGNNALWFGLGREAAGQFASRAGTGLSDSPPSSDKSIGRGAFDPPCLAKGMYDDGAFCPVCKGRMTYDYRIAAHQGGYRCSACGHSRPKPQVEVAGLNYETGEITLSGGISMRLAFPSLTGAYNLITAVAAASAVGVNAEVAARALEGYELTSGRTVSFSVDGRSGILLVSKHENSVSYDQSLAWAVGRRKPCTIVIMVDSISRKYNTSETSWLWDIDFGILADNNVKNIVLTGRYMNELAARFALTAVDPGKIGYVADFEDLRRYTKDNTTDDIFALTCFSDKAKLLKAFD